MEEAPLSRRNRSPLDEHVRSLVKRLAVSIKARWSSETPNRQASVAFSFKTRISNSSSDSDRSEVLAMDDAEAVAA